MRFLKLFEKIDDKSLTEADQIRLYRQTGEVRVLGQLYQPYMEMVFSVCFKYLKDEEASKDAVMQIFEKLIKGLKIHEVENFRGWLHRVTVNHCLIQLRMKKVFVGIDDASDSEFFSETDESSTELNLNNDLALLEKCMVTLNDEQRTSINLFFQQEKCYREISDTMGYDINKVKSYIQNGKRNLKICMDRNGKK